MTQTKRNQQMIRWVWVMGILFYGVIFTMGCKKVYITEQEVNQRIRSEIPPGSTYSQVNDFLKKYNWGGDSKLSKFEDMWTHDNLLTTEEKQKIKWNSGGGILTIEKGLIWSWGIHIEFYYDQDEKLVTYNLVKYSY